MGVIIKVKELNRGAVRIRDLNTSFLEFVYGLRSDE